MQFRLAISGALSIVLAVPALAADLRVKAPPPPVAVAAYNWTGMYVGVGAGGQTTEYDWNFFQPIVNSTTATSQRFDNAIFSVHGGYQHQFSQFVIGIEAAYTTSIDGRNTRVESACAFPAPFIDRCDGSGPKDFFTAGGRLGWTPVDRLLLFASGGYAQAYIGSDIRFGSVLAPPGPNDRPVVSNSTHARGWYVGGGFEYALSRVWWLGVEYQHIELDATAHCVNPGPGVVPCSVPNALNATITPTSDLVKVRLSLRPDFPYMWR